MQFRFIGMIFKCLNSHKSNINTYWGRVEQILGIRSPWCLEICGKFVVTSCIFDSAVNVKGEKILFLPNFWAGS
jgi:hypothetical protein